MVQNQDDIRGLGILDQFSVTGGVGIQCQDELVGIGGCLNLLVHLHAGAGGLDHHREVDNGLLQVQLAAADSFRAGSGIGSSAAVVGNIGGLAAVILPARVVDHGIICHGIVQHILRGQICGCQLLAGGNGSDVIVSTGVEFLVNHRGQLLAARKGSGSAVAVQGSAVFVNQVEGITHSGITPGECGGRGGQFAVIAQVVDIMQDCLFVGIKHMNLAGRKIQGSLLGAGQIHGVIQHDFRLADHADDPEEGFGGQIIGTLGAEGNGCGLVGVGVVEEIVGADHIGGFIPDIVVFQSDLTVVVSFDVVQLIGPGIHIAVAVHILEGDGFPDDRIAEPVAVFIQHVLIDMDIGNYFTLCVSGLGVCIGGLGLADVQVVVLAHGIFEPCTGCGGGHGADDGVQRIRQSLFGLGSIEIVDTGGHILQHFLRGFRGNQPVVADGEADGVNISAQAPEAGDVILAIQIQTLGGFAAEVIVNITVVEVVFAQLTFLGMLVDNGVELVGVALDCLCPPVLAVGIVEVGVGAVGGVLVAAGALQCCNQRLHISVRGICLCRSVFVSQLGKQIPAEFHADGLQGVLELFHSVVTDGFAGKHRIIVMLELHGVDQFGLVNLMEFAID